MVTCVFANFFEFNPLAGEPSNRQRCLLIAKAPPADCGEAMRELKAVILGARKPACLQID